MKYILNKMAMCCCTCLMLLTMLASCSDNHYVNAIPSNSTALLSVDLSQAQPTALPSVLSRILGTTQVTDCGIDLKAKLYGFETIDGNFGLCARVKDVDKLDALIAAQEGKNGNGKKHLSADVRFILIQQWLLAYNTDVLTVLGPVLPAAQAEAERTVLKMFQQDEAMSITTTPMFARIDTMQAPIFLVAQAQSLPEKFVAPFTLGAPKDADASQIMLSATMYIQDQCLHINATPYSDNKRIDKALQQSLATLRPITPTLVSAYDARSLSALFLNVKGTAFLPILQQNSGLQVLLTGVNMAIDIDNILRSVDGDLCVSMPPSSTAFTPSAIQLTAKLGHSAWLKDVDYWKQSCPQGTSITTVAADTYCYTASASSQFFFGVTPTQFFISGPSLQQALGSCMPTQHPLPPTIAHAIVGQRMAMLLNVDALKHLDPTGLATSLTSALNNVRYIVYTVR